MINLLKKLPLWVYVLVFVAILFFWQYASGWSYSNKLWNIMKAEIIADQQEIISELEKQNLINEKEKGVLYGQINDLKKQREALQQQKNTLLAKIEELNHAIENITVPASPDDLITLFHKYGFRSAVRRKPAR
jgi:peptidoglycan hydrolase CwlO-like protein